MTIEASQDFFINCPICKEEPGIYSPFSEMCTHDGRCYFRMDRQTDKHLWHIFLPLGVIAWDFENTTNHCDHHPSPLPRAQGCQKTTLGIIVENPNRENVFLRPEEVKNNSLHHDTNNCASSYTAHKIEYYLLYLGKGV